MSRQSVRLPPEGNQSKVLFDPPEGTKIGFVPSLCSIQKDLLRRKTMLYLKWYSSFLFVIGILPFRNHLRSIELFQAALHGVHAAIVGILLGALYQPIWTALFMLQWISL